jgi:methionyl-tRNA formyltransferase
VAEAALARGIPVERPDRLRGNVAFQERFAAVRPDAAAVVAYGKLLPDAILELPPLGCVNVHASLLPKYRGASPISAAILAGDQETGVVTMRIVPELDAGPIYLEKRVEIADRDDAGTLSERLCLEGAALLVETLRGLGAGTVAARLQQGEPTFTRPLTRTEGRVDWRESAGALERKRRAYAPWPGLYSVIGGKRVKLVDVAVSERGAAGIAPGTIREEAGEAIVAAGDGTALVLRSVQREGRTPTTGMEFLRGLASPTARFDPAD